MIVLMSLFVVILIKKWNGSSDYMGETDEKPEKRLADKDKKRRANYKYYTDQVWGLAQNYHLCLNSGEIGIDKCTELIVDLVK